MSTKNDKTIQKKNWKQRIRDIGHMNTNTNVSIESIESNSKKQKTDSNLSPFLALIHDIMSRDTHRQNLIQFCGQQSALPFEEVFNNKSFNSLNRFDCGSYAELFRGVDNNTNELVVLKVIRTVSSEMKSRLKGVEFRSVGIFPDIYSEFQTTAALSSLRSSSEFQTNCFPRVYSNCLVSGDIPEHFLVDNQTKKLEPMRADPFEDYPSIPREYSVIVMSFGGQPLWKFIDERSISAIQMLSVVRQVAIGLAIAEMVFEFEHRDLHISNILLKETTESKIHYIYRSKHYWVDSEGIETMIIDTTFSRIKIKNIVFNKNLTNTLKFDDKQKLSSQDKVYKSMVKMTGNDWNKFTPKSNLKWLAYVCRALFKSHVCVNSDDQNSRKRIKELYDLFNGKDSLQEIDLHSL